MTVIGLCGPIGSGKSYVGNCFSKKGVPVIDTDKVYHDLCVPGSDMLKDIEREFGEAVINFDGTLNRKNLGDIVFSDDTLLKKLNSITHFRVKEKTLEILSEYKNSDTEFVIVEVPLMFESGFDKLCDFVVCVLCDEETKIRRIIKRDGITREQAITRIHKQHDNDFYKENCKYSVINDDIADINEQVLKILNANKKGKDMENLSDTLLYKQTSAFETMDAETKNLIEEYSLGYKDFINSAKTEREAVKYSVEMAEEAGFVPYNFGDKIAPGGKYYYNNRGKNLFLFAIGTQSVENGVRIAVSHVDSPRMDLKPHPLYEDSGMAFFKTHYYGGIKKYQWTTIPLALHGTVYISGGKTVDICIGENEDDPIFYINDLLPHLARAQMSKNASDVVPAEKLNILVGSEPCNDDEAKEKIKLNVLKILNEKYGIKEADFISAELCAVPAYKARDIGFDRALIGAYGHDDRVCAYPALTAILEAQNPKNTLMTILADKEEIGSDGNSGMQCELVIDLLREIALSQNVNFSRLKANSKCLSADVNAAYDPNFSDVYDKVNASQINHGVVLTKYTGSGGKYSSSDASAEFVGYIRDVFDRAGVLWQLSELGQVDAGGGGTVAKYIAKYNIDVVDLGVAVISMHAPYEVISKADLYSTYSGISAFFNF